MDRMLEALAARCAQAGFDLLAPFDVAAFNAVAGPQERLPDHGRGHALAVVIGNGRALWPIFRSAADGPPDPLDRYTVRTLTAAAEATGLPFVALWAHTMRPRPIPIQRVAQAAGLAGLSPSHLSIHPRLGPWLALRAVMVFDAPPPPPPPALSPPCAGCAQPCMPALAAALAEPADWRRWLAVRDACPVGREHRYGSEQIHYHYTKRWPASDR
jgi:methylmalonic aciduria homocystinuria type C protein